MSLSAQIQAGHATPSQSRSFIAYIAGGKLRVSATHAPERYVHFSIRIASKDVNSLRWDDSDTRIAVVSARTIEVVDLEDESRRVVVDNGAGGLGAFASANFIGPDQLLVLWEFGRAKVWNLSTGRAVELGDVKTSCVGSNWERRPGDDPALRAVAMLSRPGIDDLLHLHFPVASTSISSIKLVSEDARSLSWSPDGRWLAILDAPTAFPSVHFYTPDGHHFRSYPPAGLVANTSALGVKALVWSPTSQMVALTSYSGRITLLNTRTFSPLAIIEHTTTIERPLSADSHAPIWQETVSASGARAYTAQPLPFSPPQSRPRGPAAAATATEPQEQGVAEASFSSDGAMLATRDERALSTAWLWDVRPHELNSGRLRARAVLVQHANVRRMLWHPARGALLLLDCGDGVACTFDATPAARDPPRVHLLVDDPRPAATTAASNLAWLVGRDENRAETRSVIALTSRASFRLLCPDSEALATDGETQTAPDGDVTVCDEGSSEGDSLLDLLSGRKPLPPRIEPSYTQRIDLEVGIAEADSTAHPDDTFVGKKTTATLSRKVPALDPLDDSDIF